MKILLLILSLALTPLCFAANPSFQSFELSQFSTNSLFLAIKSASKQTNNDWYGMATVNNALRYANELNNVTASSTISAQTAALHALNASPASCTITSTPFITTASSAAGQIIYLEGAGVTTTVTLQSESVLTGSGMVLNADTRTLTTGDTLALIRTGTDNKWHEIGFSRADTFAPTQFDYSPAPNGYVVIKDGNVQTNTQVYADLESSGAFITRPPGFLVSITQQTNILLTAANSFMLLQSDDTIATNRVLQLEAAIKAGTHLWLQNIDPTGRFILRNVSTTGDGATNFINGDWNPGFMETMKLIYNGTNWAEEGRSYPLNTNTTSSQLVGPLTPRYIPYAVTASQLGDSEIFQAGSGDSGWFANALFHAKGLAFPPGSTVLVADDTTLGFNSTQNIISSDNATPANRTFHLGNGYNSAGLDDGFVVILRWTGANAGELPSADTNLVIGSTWTPVDGNILCLMWDLANAKWREQWRYPVASSGGGDTIWTNNAGAIQPNGVGANTNAIVIASAGQIGLGNLGAGETGIYAAIDATTFSSDVVSFRGVVYDYSGAGLDTTSSIGNGLSGAPFSAVKLEVSTNGFTSFNHFEALLVDGDLVVRATNELNTLFSLHPTASASETPYTFDTSLTHTSGNLVSIGNSNHFTANFNYEGGLLLGTNNVSSWPGQYAWQSGDSFVALSDLAQGDPNERRTWLEAGDSNEGNYGFITDDATSTGVSRNMRSRNSTVDGNFRREINMQTDNNGPQLDLTVTEGGGPRKLVKFKPMAGVSEVPFILNTYSNVPSGNLFTVVNSNTTVMAVSAVSGYAGAGTKFLSDDGTYKTALTSGDNWVASGTTNSTLAGNAFANGATFTNGITSGTSIFNAVGALSTPGISAIGTWITGGSATTTKPYVFIEPSGTTSTAWSTSGTGLGINAAAAFTGNLTDLQLGGVSKFRVTSSGAVTTPTGYTGGTLTITAAGNITMQSGLGLYCPSDGVVRLTDSGYTTFNRLQLGGTTSSYPSIKRNLTAVNFRLADDSADAAVTTGALTVSGTLISSTSSTPASAAATGTAGTIAWDASYIYVCVAANTWKRVAIATW